MATKDFTLRSGNLAITGTKKGVVLGNVIVRSSSTCDVVFGNGLTASTTGLRNVSIGVNALQNNTTGSENIAQGYNALYCNTTGCYNLAMGRDALYCNTGSRNIAIGFAALTENAGGNDNIAQGYSALYGNTIGTNNTALGYQALCYNTEGCYNFAVGNSALKYNTTGSYNIAIGASALYCNQVSGIIGLGCSTLYNNTTGTFNIAIGNLALALNSTGSNNLAQGYRSQCGNTTGGNNISFGSTALVSNTTGSCNIAIGTGALCAATPSNLNIAVGFGAGSALTTGVNNTIIGNLAGSAGLVCTLLLGAGTCERIKVDNTGIYVNGSALSTSSAAGGTGAVQYANGTALAGDNTKFYYDNTNVRLGIGTSVLTTATLVVKGSLPTLLSTLSGTDYQAIVGNTASYGSTIGWSPTNNRGYLQLVGGVQMLQWNSTGLGIGGVVAANTLDVSGGTVIGGGIAYAGTATAPTNGLLVEGAVGIGTTTVSGSYKLEVKGALAATTKSFVIDHPTKPGMKLRYGSLEGPENGVYIRGRTTNKLIELPDHWVGLVDFDSITVNLTPIGKKQELFVKSISEKGVVIGGARGIDCFYTIFAERNDVPKLEVEIY